MSRPVRIEYPGAFYHVLSHGNGRQWLYRDQHQIDLFVSCLREVIEKYHIVIHAAVLMRNHYHLLVETPEGNVSAAIGRLNSEFARLLNRNLKRKGSIFQKRFKSILVDTDQYYSTLYRYIYQNPVRVGLTARCESYPGSGLYWLSDINKRNVISWSDLKFSFAGSRGWSRELMDLVNGQLEPSPYPKHGRISILGTKEWVVTVRGKVASSLEGPHGIKEFTEVEFSHRELEKSLRHAKRKDRKDLNLLLKFKHSGRKMEEIRREEGIKSYHALAQRLYRIKRRIKADPELKRVFSMIEKSLLKVKARHLYSVSCGPCPAVRKIAAKDFLQ